MPRTFTAVGGGVTIPINTNTPDAFGDYWFCFDIEGWDSPDLRQKLADRQGEHGTIVTESMLGSRLLTVKQGLCFPRTNEQHRWDAMDRLATIANLVNGSTGTLTAVEGTLNRYVTIQRGAGKPIMEPLPEGDGGVQYGHVWPFKFTCALLAQDPRRYSVTTHGPTALPATIVNAGDFPSKPILVVTGGGEATTITCGGLSVILTTAYGAVPSPLTIDLLNQTAVDGSGNNHMEVISGPTQWWSLAAGSNAVTISGPGTATISWKDSWS